MVFRAVAPRPKAAFFLMIMSAHGTFETCRLHQAMSEFEGKAENMCSY